MVPPATGKAERVVAKRFADADFGRAHAVDLGGDGSYVAIGEACSASLL